MSKYNEKGLTMDNWHKCPNSLVDRLMGTVLSPTATCVVLTVWRLTEGVRERHQAAIPTETFMRVTKTNRKKTAYDYVNEAIKTGLINVKKERGKVNVYSINKKCPLWYAAEVVAESVPSTESATSDDNCHIVVAESVTGLEESSGGKRHTYKDIKIKDNIKDIKKASDKESKSKEKVLNIPFDTFWDLYDHKSTNKKTAQTKWKNLTNQQRQAVIDHLPAYIQSTPDKKYRKHPSSYLTQEHWNTPIEQPTAKKIDRATDKLAVNQNWAGANKSNIVEANTTIEEMMGSW